eukprot:COSAG02_NODE_7843_length_2822_cov_6.232831_4_plen_73_part_00
MAAMLPGTIPGMAQGLRLSHLRVLHEAKLLHQCPKFWVWSCIALDRINKSEACCGNLDALRCIADLLSVVSV